MDAFTERMVERAQKRKERLNTHLKHPTDNLSKEALDLKENKNLLTSDLASNRMKGILQNGSISVSSDKTENTGFVFKANSEQNPASSAVEVSSISHLPNSKKTLQPQKMKPMEPLNSFKEASMKCRFLSEIGTTSGVPNSPKKSISIDPCELSIADRKALFERNKGQAPLPKAPYSQALPAQKKENGKPPIDLPAKPPPIHVENKLIDRNIPARENKMPSPSHLPPSPPPKPDHLRAFLEKIEADTKIKKADTSTSNLELKDQDTSYESVASSESSLGQKIVRLAQKRGKEIEESKRQISLNTLSASECDFDSNDKTSDKLALNNGSSGPTPPKQFRESSGSSHDMCFDDNSALNTNPSQKTGNENEDGINCEQPLTHTVSFYRKTKHENEKHGSSLVKKVVHQSISSISCQSSKKDEELEREAVSKKIAELQLKISAEATAIAQANQALNLCSSLVEFHDSPEQIEADRLLLLATHRRQAAMNEAQRLKVEGTVRPRKPNMNNLLDQGSLTVSEITLPVKFDAIQIAAREEMCHHFVCLLKCDEVVLGTSMMTATMDNAQQTSKGIVYMQFPNSLTFPKLYSDFKVTIEIYDLLARSKEAVSHDAKHFNSNKKDLHKFRITPKKQKNNSKSTTLAVPPVPGASCSRASRFTMVGYIVFSLREVQRTQFTLNKVTYSNPLDGKVQLKLSCELSPTVEQRGFLTMFEDVSGFGAWHRRWCLLKGDSLSYWKYPDDERTKLPIDTIDLNTCTSQSISAVSRDICARPNTFLLETIRPARDEDEDSLVLVRHAAHTMVRHLLSTDTKEERLEWCATLNKALDIIRAWRKK
nr:PREDICTED: actin-binding protein anillin-like [Bemisia tabaci]